MVIWALKIVINFFKFKNLGACRSKKKPTKPNLNFLCKSLWPLTYNVFGLGEGGDFYHKC
jgi:hypothetical protein